MRLHEVEQGDGPLWSLLIRGISLLSGRRLPDAARAVLYHQAFFGDAMSTWTHATMRGASPWTVGERELMAALTATWNACPFCIGAHGAIAARVLGKAQVQAALADYQQAPLSPKLQSVLSFLERVTRQPDAVTEEDAQTVLQSDVTVGALEDALAVCTLFNITTRCADALAYQIVSETDFDRAAKQLLVRGYGFGKPKTPAHPDHRALADALAHRVLEGPGVTAASLRQTMAARAAGGPPVEAPYDDLARQIGEAAYNVTDEQVAQVVTQSGSERATYELIVAAAVGAGLHRWQRGLTVIEPAYQTA
jgi:uncharacterized peroxidase-related enzyme